MVGNSSTLFLEKASWSWCLEMITKVCLFIILVNVLLLCVAFSPAVSASQESKQTLLVDDSSFRQSLFPYATFLEDQTGIAPFQQVLTSFRDGEFSPLTGRNIQFGYSQSTYWVGLYVTRTDLASKQLFLEIRYPPLDFLEVYLAREDQLISLQLGGDSLPYTARFFPIRYYLFPLVLDQSGDYILLVRVKSNSSLSVPMYLSDVRDLVIHEHYSQLGLGIFYGVAFGLFMYNFFLYCIVRDVTYVFYLSYILSHALFMASIDGLLFAFWPNNIEWESRSIYLFAWLAAFFLYLFCRSFLQTKKAMPKLDRFLIVMQWITGIGAVSFIIIPVSVAARINAPGILVTIVILFSVALLRYVQGYKPASYFSIGMGAFLLGGAAIASGALDIFASYDVSPLIGKVGAAIELVFFSMGLGSRINSLKSEQSRALRDAEIARADAKARAEKAKQIQAINSQLSHTLVELELAKQKAEAADMQKTRFLAAASHDIRQPLNALGLIAETLQFEESVTPNVKKKLNTLRKSANNLIDIFESLFEISRYDNQLSNANIETVDGWQCISEFVDSATPLFDANNINLSVEIHESIDDNHGVVLYTNKTLLMRLLWIIADNAIKHACCTHVLINVEKQNDTEVSISIIDNGIGIPIEEKERVFEEFYQLNNPERDHHKGMGLGLAMAKRIAELLGIRIAVASLSGDGTRFVLGIKAAFASGVALPESPANTKDFSFAPCRALIVEDEAECAAAILELLQGWGMECRTTKTFDEVRQLLDSGDWVPDLALLDYRLPGALNGIDVGIAITKRLSGECLAVLVTGEMDVLLEDSLFEVFQKPLRPARLSNYLHAQSEWLSRVQQRQTKPKV